MDALLAKFGFSFSPYTLARSLSGGNLQRLIIAREMAYQPKLIIASYLTSGLDVQSTTVARQALLQARDEGAHRARALRNPTSFLDIAHQVEVLDWGWG